MRLPLFDSRPVLILAAAVVALAPGCAGSSRGTQVGDGGLAQALVGRSCNVDSECGELRCDAVRRQCICLSDDTCKDAVDATGAPARLCNNFTGLCSSSVAGCKADGECPAASYCESQTRSCKVRKGFCDTCGADRSCGGPADDCLEDKSLRERFCGVSCKGDGDCPNGATCQDFSGKRQCWPKPGKNCRTFTGCTPDSRKTCQKTEDCADVPDQVCDPGAGVCTARVQLCPFGQVCDSRSRVCVDACGSDAECVAIDAKLRCVNRACEPLGQCVVTAQDPTGDKSCPLNKVCSIAPGTAGGSCVPYCSSSNECGPGNICQRTSDNRSKCLPGCLANADCPLDRKCVRSGTAVGTCQGTPGQTCQADSVCPTCSVCDLASSLCQSGKGSLYCKPCSGDSECGRGHCLSLKDGKRCGQPCPATGCPRGFVCAEICFGTYQGGICQGSRIAECVPADQSCTLAGANKCG